MGLMDLVPFLIFLLGIAVGFLAMVLNQRER